MTINNSEKPMTNGHASSHGANGNGIPAADRHSAASRPIAIVGVSCRFAGSATSPSKLWDMCAEGRSAWSRIPEDRFDVKSFYHPDKERPGRNHATGGHFLEQDVGVFDAAFFNLSADVANAMDPQLRWLLECVYEAMEDAGIPAEKLVGSDTSVYTGCYGKDYHELQTRDPECLPAAFLTGNGTAMLSNRISHFYDLQGPSMSIDTGCSSGLVCLHEGCRSIALGESDLAIIAASTAILSPDLYIAMSSLSMVGADGKCYAWDSRAQGYGRGEGTATLILKPLDAAIRDGDHVHAIVRESGLNQDGKTTSITSPSMEAQVKLIERCYRRAGLNLADTAFVEAHMTGTPTGDRVEAEALARTFGKSRKAGDPIIVGSVKTNVGHTESASGLAGIIKAIWALKNKQIPQNMNYETPNPKIPLKEWNLSVPTTLMPWPTDKPLRVSINNYGYGGTNSHVILEGAPDVSGRSNSVAASEDNGRSRIYLLSGKDVVALKGNAANLASHIRESLTNDDLGDLAFTLSERRSRLPYVATVRASNVTDLSNKLGQSSLKTTHVPDRQPRLGFVFNGQGAQWHAMGRELISAYPVFSSAIHRADKILKGYGASWSLYEELLRDPKTTRIAEVNLSQPVTVALQLCLVDLLKSWGITPAAVTSHSSGEIAAGYVYGVMSFEEALGVSYYRGHLALQNEPLKKLTGGMMAAGLGPEDAAKYLDDTPGGRVAIACVNSPGSVTLSGDMEALEVVEKRIQDDGIFARKLKVPLAYHSHHMMCLAKDYTNSLHKILSKNADVDSSVSSIRYASPVTGEIVTSPKDLTPEHWVRNLTSPVLFSQSFQKMCLSDDGTAQLDMIVEVGPHGTLSGPIRQILKAQGKELPYASCLQRGVDAVETMQTLACELISRGYPVSLSAINFPLGEKHSFLPDLPSYAWNHTQRYWIESRVNKQMCQKKFEPHELLGSILPGSNDLAPTWRNFLRLADLPWLMDHQVDGGPVLPGAGYITMAIEATRLLTSEDKSITSYSLRDVEILNALSIPDGSAGVEVQLTMRPAKEGGYEFTSSSIGVGDSWLVNCKGYVSAESEDQPNDENRSVRPDAFFTPGLKARQMEPDSLFAGMREMGFYHGPTFQNLASVNFARKKAIAGVVVPDVASETHDYVIHPTTLDSIIVAAYTNLPKKIQQSSLVVPRSIGSMSIRSNVNQKAGEKLLALAECLKSDKRGFTSSIAILNGDGEDSAPVIDMTDFYAIAVPRPVDELLKRPMTSTVHWEPDVFSSQVPQAFTDALWVELKGEAEELEKKLLRASYYMIHDAVKELQKTYVNGDAASESHYSKLFAWMNEIVTQGENGSLAPKSETWARVRPGRKQMLYDELSNGGNAGTQLTIRVGRQLSKIIRGEVAPLDLMKEGDLLSQYHTDLPRLRDRSYKQLRSISELYALKNPGAHVLEIGARAGAATQAVLDGFGAKAERGSLLGHYTFTDASDSMFETAKQKFAQWGDIMSFETLDIEEDPLGQSFEAATFDLIVASQVLHGASSLSQAMSNVRKLLKPGGKLIMIETTHDRPDAQLVFSTLPAWWESEEPPRQSSPNLPVETWNKVLSKTGFSGVDFHVPDCEAAAYQSTSVIVATAEAKASYPSAVSIVHAGTAPPSQWLQELSSSVTELVGTEPDVEHLYDIEASEEKLYIFTPEIASPFVHSLDKPSFEKLRELLVSCQNILWLSSGGAVDSVKPVFAETQGLLRTLRQEDRSKRCVQLDFAPSPDGTSPWTSDKIPYILDVLKQGFNSNIVASEQDFEYAVKDSAVYVPRLYPDMEVKAPTEDAPLPLDSSAATYLIVGGMGGIGRVITSWMMEMGAKNLLVVSRNAEASPDVPDMQLLAEADGCNLVIRSCDVSDEESFLKLVAESSGVLPPIRGVIHAAMALEDTVLERMSYDQWRRGVRAKVDNSINLHKHLSSLDFFVVLSSVTGVVGHSSQANYTAGNTFLDALARHRTARGQPAVALDLSAIKGAGWVDSQSGGGADVLRRVEALGTTSVDIDVVLSLVEDAIRHPLRESPAASQVVVGIASEETTPEGSAARFDSRFGTVRLATVRGSDQGAGGAGSGDGTGAKDSLAELTRGTAAGTIKLPEATELIMDAVATKVATIFNIDRSEIDAGNQLSRYGVDSLVAVDLRNWLSSGLRARVSIFDILQTPSLTEFASLVVGKSDLLTGLAAE
ncbi:polyketide synthase [Xylariomycetidae sp. FL2044]|nr:polyketide synthase [Xylariomycetidae sp. FL2044]